MVEHYLGEETFRRGVHNYLDAHRYGNATAEDFWGAQTSASGKPVDKIMESFVAQPGVPLLRFSAPNGGTVSVQQSRFFLTPGSGNTQQSWTIPICLKGSPCQVITPGAGTLHVSGSLPFANADAKGYYRSEYDPATLRSVIAGAASLKAPERINLIGDRLALMRAGQSSAGDYLDLVAALRNDPNAEVLAQAFSGINTIDERVADDAQRRQLREWIRREFAPVYAALGPAPEHEDQHAAQRRLALFQVLGYAGDPAVLSQAHDLAVRFLQGDTSASPEFASAGLGVATIRGDAALYDQVLQFQKTTQNPSKKTQALFTLASFDDPALVQRTLDYVTSGEVRNQDSWIPIAIELSRYQTRAVAWQYVKTHWDRVHAQFTMSSGNQVVGATGSFCSAADRADVQQFFAEHKVDASERALRNALQAIDSCVQFRGTQNPKLTQWLATQTGQ